jgi:signal transduction histidine kinase
MRERAELINAELVITSELGEGTVTSIKCELPEK